MKKKPHITTVAIPPDVLSKIRKIADNQHRSLSGQIVAFLVESVVRFDTAKDVTK